MGAKHTGTDVKHELLYIILIFMHILVHPNTKFFISHCDQDSLTEVILKNYDWIFYLNLRLR